MQEVRLKKEAWNRAGCDITWITLAQLKTLLKIAYQDGTVKEVRVNNITFSRDDTELLIEQGYSNIQWLLPFGEYYG